MKMATGSKRKAQKAQVKRRKPGLIEPENDNDPNVQIEIRAAQLASGKRPMIWETRAAASHSVDISGRLATVSTASLAFLDWWAGWLWSEMRTHDLRDERDRDAWPWDPSRPIAGQFEEYVAHMARGDAMLEAAIAVDRPTQWFDGPVQELPPRQPHIVLDPLDRVILAGAPEVIGKTPRQVRDEQDEADRIEDEIRAAARATTGCDV